MQAKSLNGTCFRIYRYICTKRVPFLYLIRVELFPLTQNDAEVAFKSGSNIGKT